MVRRGLRFGANKLIEKIYINHICMYIYGYICICAKCYNLDIIGLLSGPVRGREGRRAGVGGGAQLAPLFLQLYKSLF